MTQEYFNQIPVARRYKLGGVQKIVAEKMLAGLHDTASVTSMAEVNAQALLTARARLCRQYEKVTLTHLMIHSLARCLEWYPQLNGVIHDGHVHEFGEINIALAIALQNGDLQVVVIRRANEKSVPEIAEEAHELFERAHNDQLEMKDVRGGTFTLSNYGQLRHVVWATPIISPGQSGVLGMGRIRPRPVEENDEEGHVMQQIMPLSFTYDHRIINGIPAGRFLEDLAMIMENTAMESADE